MNTQKTTLDQWRALQAVVDFGGYAQAAEQLFRSQSTISYTVAKLQAEGKTYQVWRGISSQVQAIGKRFRRTGKPC